MAGSILILATKISLLAEMAIKFALVFCLMFFLANVKAEETVFRVKKITAGFVYNFAKLAVWDDLPDQEVVKLCIAARPDFVNIFQQLSGKKVAERTLVPLEYSKDIHNDCQILFIDKARRAEFPCAQLRSSLHLLTISNAPNFARNCGIIRLFEENNRLRFEINVDAVKRAELRLSSHLYKLARIVRDDR